MSPSCRHKVCLALADGACHIDASGWLVNVTREQWRAVVPRALGLPNDDAARMVREMTDLGVDLVKALTGMLDNPKIGARDRRLVEKQLERCRLSGIPRAFKE